MCYLSLLGYACRYRQMVEVLSGQNSIVLKLEVTLFFEVATSDPSWCQNTEGWLISAMISWKCAYISLYQSSLCRLIVRMCYELLMWNSWLNCLCEFSTEWCAMSEVVCWCYRGRGNVTEFLWQWLYIVMKFFI